MKTIRIPIKDKEDKEDYVPFSYRENRARINKLKRWARRNKIYNKNNQWNITK